MKRMTLPQTDLEVSLLCCGTGSFGTGTRGDETDRLIAAYAGAGGNFYDTAHCYAFWVPNGLGASERELAASLRRLGLLETSVIATKGGHSSGGDAYPRPEACLAPQLVLTDIEESLNRLGVECIDLYYLHRDDGRTPIDEIMETLNSEIRRGRLRYLAASNWSIPRLAAANAYAASKGLQGFVASQVQWSLAEPSWKPGPDPVTRFVTDEEAAWHTESGVPLIVYSATANGFFAGAPHSFGTYQSPSNAARRERAEQLATTLDCTPTQVALAYLLHQPMPVIPIFGTTNPAHLTEILGSVNVSLTPEQVHWLKDG